MLTAEELLKEIFAKDAELKPRIIDKPVVLYGAGSLGKMAADFFNYLKIPFLYVVDKYAAGAVRPEEVPEPDKKNYMLIVCIANLPFFPLRNELKRQGWKDIAFFYDVSEAYRDRHPLSNGWFLGHCGEIEKNLALKVFASLTDDASRAHYVQFLAWRKLRMEIAFDGFEINTGNRFFIPEVLRVLRGDEVFVDGGAHHGSITERFLLEVENKYKDIYAIEPDAASFAILKKKLKIFPKLNFLQCALSDKAGEEKFYNGFDFASKLSKDGGSLVKAITLDSLKIAPTFIKLHLEGGELPALKGAKKAIAKCRPIIAATIYHSPDGAWKIPHFVIKNTKNYKYFIRLHSWAGTGAVFYAIPQER